MDYNAEKAKLPGWLVHTPLIDTYEGLSSCGTADAYVSAIDIFVEHVAENIDEIESYFKDGDIEGYTVRAHALKSTSRIIGAMVLSSTAAVMEKAGEEKNIQFIHDFHPAYIGLYRRYEQLFVANMAKVEKKELPEGELEDAMMALKEYAEAEDFSLLGGALDYLVDYNLPPEVEEALEKARKSLLKLDWKSVRSVLEI